MHIFYPNQNWFCTSVNLKAVQVSHAVCCFSLLCFLLHLFDYLVVDWHLGISRNHTHILKLQCEIYTFMHKTTDTFACHVLFNVMLDPCIT